MIMRYKKITLLLSTLLFYILLLPLISFSHTITGKVISVADGDTITILTQQHEQIIVRLAAIDTPEKSQAFGEKAKRFISSMVAGKNVSIEPETIDKYGRTVAMVYINSSNLNEQIVKQGFGWVYRKYCKEAFCDDWLELEKKARNSQIGLWGDKNPVPPWDWRHEQRTGGNSGIKSSVVGGTGIYHGNVNSHVFHGCNCQHYNCKNCTIIFRSVNEAVNAGYRAHKECVNK